MYIMELLARQKDNDSTALIYGDKRVTYKEMYNAVLAISHELAAQSEKYRSIGLFINNSVNYVKAYFAITFTGHVIVPISPRIKAGELVSTILYCELGVIVTDTSNMEQLRKELREIQYLIKVFNMDTLAFEEVGKTAFLPVSGGNELDEVALMLHTSGSLSLPKRVMLTHKNLVSCAEAIIESLGITKTDRTLIALPLFLASANTSQMLTHIYLGASMVILDTMFTAGYFFKLTERHIVTNFTGVPYMMRLLTENTNMQQCDISSLRFICFGGAPTPLEIIHNLMTAFPAIQCIHMYGQTEASTRISHLLPGMAAAKAGSVGKPLPGMECKLADSEGRSVEAGEVGEVLVKGLNVMKGYYKRAELTSQTVTDGWLHTGDLGRYDEDGFLYIVGRNKNVIIKGGMNIYPEEIEEVLCMHPDVKEAYVFGEKDELLGEVPVAEVVLKNYEIHITINDLMKYCIDNLSSYKLPKEIIPVSQLPRTETGKILRIGSGKNYSRELNVIISK